MSVERAKSVPPFVLWCTAMIPTAFDDSMSYYEALSALYKFIQDNLVEPINNNATILEQTVKDMATLKEYVDNYFENLDVQEEINNKLDDMAEGGQLAAIIAEFLAMSPVFGYGTIAEMAAATNLTDGCIARVLGNTSAADGNGAFYKVRTKESGESADGVQKVAIGDSLIADRIIDATAISLQEQIDELKEPTKKYLLVGDSYAEGYTPDGNVVSWATKLKTKLGLSDGQCIIKYRGGMGFSRESQYNFYTLISEVPDDTEITDVVIGGGFNDAGASYNAISTGISNVYTLCSVKFPNAKVHIAPIGWSKNASSKSSLIYTYNYYNAACNNIPQIDYLMNTQYALHNYFEVFSSDGFHPNENGQTAIANAVYDAMIYGCANISITSDFDFDVADGAFSVKPQMNTFVNNDSTTLWTDSRMELTWTSGNYPTLGSISEVEIGTITHGAMIGTTGTGISTVVPAIIKIDSSSTAPHATGEFYSIPVRLKISSGKIYAATYSVNTAGTAYGSYVIKQLQIPSFSMTTNTILA